MSSMRSREGASPSSSRIRAANRLKWVIAAARLPPASSARSRPACEDSRSGSSRIARRAASTPSPTRPCSTLLRRPRRADAAPADGPARARARPTPPPSRAAARGRAARTSTPPVLGAGPRRPDLLLEVGQVDREVARDAQRGGGRVEEWRRRTHAPHRRAEVRPGPGVVDVGPHVGRDRGTTNRPTVQGEVGDDALPRGRDVDPSVGAGEAEAAQEADSTRVWLLATDLQASQSSTGPRACPHTAPCWPPLGPAPVCQSGPVVRSGRGSPRAAPVKPPAEPGPHLRRLGSVSTGLTRVAGAGSAGRRYERWSWLSRTFAGRRDARVTPRSRRRDDPDTLT